jgi:two-component system CheB/CheR fusion protein
LQTTNEEIQTSKEEMQSLNEELLTVNTELQSTIDKLASVNDDMNNLFNSTEIAAFFLDSELRIKRFTPKAQEFIHLIHSDIGRFLKHFSTTIKYDKLLDNAEEVLRTLIQKNIEVESKDNRWYHIRILPYRTLTNVIDGVVITLSDVTAFKEYEFQLSQLNNALQASLNYAENIVNTVREPLLALNHNLQIVSASRSFYKIFRMTESETIGTLLYNLGNNQWDIPQLRELLHQVLTENQSFENFMLENDFPLIGHKQFLLNARKINQQPLADDMILLTLEIQ